MILSGRCGWTRQLLARSQERGVVADNRSVRGVPPGPLGCYLRVGSRVAEPMRSDQPERFARAAANVLSVWNLKSETEAAAWLQNSTLNPTLKADLLKAAQP